MSSHPLNLALRFLLELAALAAMAYWGWTTQEGAWRVVLAVGIPLVAAALWGTFRVPGDPAKAPVAVPGLARLLLEFAFFGAAAGLLIAANQPTTAQVLAVVVILHYIASYDRIRWLLTQR